MYTICRIILRTKLLILLWYLENAIIIIDKQWYCIVINFLIDDIQIIVWFPGLYCVNGNINVKNDKTILMYQRGMIQHSVFAVLRMIVINPRVSTRQIERELGIPKSTSHRIFTHNFYPYHITLTQQLTLNDFQQRLEFYRWAQIMLNRDRIFFRFILFSDEATFHNTGQLSRYNSHYWSVENPHWYREINRQHRWWLTEQIVPYCT